HSNVRERHGMAHRNQLRRPLRRHDSRRARHFQWIALRILRQRPQDLGTHENEGGSLCRARRSRFRRHVHHLSLALRIVVRKLGRFLRHHQQVIVSPSLARADSEWGRASLGRPYARKPRTRAAIASTTIPTPPPQSARDLEESPHNNSPEPAQRYRPSPATAPVPPRHFQTLPKAPPEETSSGQSWSGFLISAAP